MMQQVAPIAVWPLIGLLIVLCLVLLVFWMRQRQIGKRARQQVGVLKASVQARDEELGHLVSDRLPQLMETLLAQPGSVPGLRDNRLAGTRFAQDVEAVAKAFEAAAAQFRQQADHAVRDTLGGIIGQVQSLIGEQEVALRAMQHRHEHPDVLKDLLHLDHLNAQMTRKTQSVAVLCGRWVGRQRDASTLTDVVRGAITKIGDFARVQYAENDEVAVTAQAVEGVVLSLAELLENATRKSEPNAPVRVSIMLAYNGVAITVDDCGIGMTDQQVHQARQILSGTRPIDITRLGDPPRIGFPAIAALAATYGFSAHLDGQSSSGGLSATIFLPSALLTPAERPASRAAGTVAPSPPAPRPAVVNGSGLPQRTRARAASAPSVTARMGDPQTPPRRTPEETGDRLGAFQSGIRAGRPADASEYPDS